MLLYVLQSEGSSPGRQGFFMGVNSLGQMSGSIGGGIMEHKFVEMAKARLREQGSRYKVQGSRFRELDSSDKSEGSSGAETVTSHESEKAIIKKQVHDKSAAENQSGMICSGEQTILLYPITEGDEFTILNIINSTANHQNGTLVLSPLGIEFIDSQPAKDFEFKITSEQSWTYKEKTGYKNQLYIVGGGHCALALSQLMRQMDFYVRLFEERSQLNTLEQNKYVHQKTVVESYSELSDLIPQGANQYVVIMTVGYRTDYLALKALLVQDFKYVGVLGSRKKMEKLLTDLEAENVDPKKLYQVYTPVGITINSHTPEEIAVSIAAEIIMVKNQK